MNLKQCDYRESKTCKDIHLDSYCNNLSLSAVPEGTQVVEIQIRHHLATTITESQNIRGWQGPLWVI